MKKQTFVYCYGSVNWYNHLGGQFGNICKNSKICVSFDKGIPLVGIYSKKKSYKYTRI